MSEITETSTAQEAQQTASSHDRLLPSIICPHCHQKFKYEDTLWVATHPDLKGDLLVGPSAMARFRPTRFNVAGEALDPKGSPCREMACPHCHLIFPRILLENDPLYISIIGAPFSGKTTLLAAMIAQQRIHFPRDFALAFGDVDVTGHAFFEINEAPFSPLAQKTPASIPATSWPGSNYLWTRQKELDISVPRPLLFMVRPEGVHPNANNPDIGARTVCYYDNSGVNFAPTDDPKIHATTSHLNRSKVLLVVFDPTQSPAVREKLLSASTDPQLARGPVMKQETIIREATNRIRNQQGLSASQRIERPVLVVMPKADIWLSLLGEDISKEPYVQPASPAAQSASSIRCCRLDLARVEGLSDKIEAWVKANSPEIYAALKESFSNIRYIPVSATGHSPSLNAGRYAFDNEEMRPQWVCVPLLYAFARFSTTMVVGTGVAV